ncbi:Outer membrane protein beta-barrel domain-containing protein [Cyclobacterium lianum]|uniref:Outer membrane protein beta-barrel domain-containing protein n=1 Tax=Cyclobacterium lianum TaxID=388280 RepID=A0A1M7PR57_9BACT|nr:outer membrane beta-barrel protein [Cyclobacterium lianum]SHN19821.1 Outer membrane protein beta-barrel domain-containing protein [Cyclobacterium lianum]
MQNTHIWHQFHIYRHKISLIAFFLLIIQVLPLQAQQKSLIFNASGSDDQALSYGFFLAAHNSSLRIKYSDNFMDPAYPGLENVRAIMPVFSPGFALGFLVTGRLHDQLNLMFTPKVGFYEYRTELQLFTDDGNSPNGIGISTVPLLTEETLVEFPLLVKYKSERFNNTRMFFVGGLNGQIRTKNQEEANEDPVVLKGRDLAVEMGLGFDLYFQYFKFSPEIRFSHGLMNLYQPGYSDERLAGAISDIRRKSITLYLNFQ